MAMYIAYRLFLSRDNQHTFNRFVILAIYAVSFLWLPVSALLAGLFADGEGAAPGRIDILTDLAVSAGAPPGWGRIVLWIYLVGMCILALRTGITWLRIAKIIRNGEKAAETAEGTLILTDRREVAPFSWMHYLVMSRDDYEACGSTIIVHELHHIRARHWVDLFVAQAVVIINWFNPASWLMREDMMLIHEYQADMAVLSSGKDAKEYQLLLIRKAVGARFPSLANSLNHSNLKKRITMMYKTKSSPGARLKALALVPAVALALAVAAVPRIKAAVSVISDSSVIADKVTKNSSSANVRGEEYRVTSFTTNGDKTVVTVAANIPSQSITVNGATLSGDGQALLSEGINCTMHNDKATVTVTFPRCDISGEIDFTLSANGNVHHTVLNKNNPAGTSVQMGSVLVDGEDGIKVDEVNNLPVTPNGYPDMDFYIDGKKCDASALGGILPSQIQDMVIDKQANAVRITLRK